MSSETKTNQQSAQQTSPWAPQQAALTNAFDSAGNSLKTAQTAQSPTDFTAQYTPDQLATFRQMLNYSSTNPVPGQQANAGSDLTNAGVQGLQGGLYGLANFSPTELNNPQALTDAANRYADGQNIDAQVAQAMHPAVEQARDVTMPGIEQSAATTGNTNSSRTGVADGLVERGLAENAQNLGASLRSSAYQNYMNLASSNATNNNNAILTALQGRINGGSQAANTGLTAGNDSIANSNGLFDIAGRAGSGEQAANQADLTNQLNKYQAGVSSPFDALNQYMRIVGANNWGSNSTGTTSGTTTSTPSAWQVLGGLLGGAGSIAGTAGGLGWKPFA